MFVSLFLLSQTANEAIMYSNNQLYGTARSTSLGNAFGALAADFTGVSINPAVGGTYRSSEYALTTGLHSFSTKTFFENSTMENEVQKLSLPNMHLMIVNDFDEGPIRFSNWGIGYTQNNFFHQKSSFIGNTDGTIINRFLEELNEGDGISYDQITDTYPFTNALAWEGYLINNVSNEDTTHFVGIYEGGVQTSGVRSIKGRQTNLVLNYGANFNDNLFFGFTLGIPSIKYQYENTYAERDVDNVIDDFNSFYIQDEITSNATGLYLQGGVIYQINRNFRLGSSYKTSTAYLFTDVYGSSIISEFQNAQYEYSSPEGNFEYVLNTPSVWTNSLAVIFSKGLISIDIDLIDYSIANYDLGAESDNPDDWFYGASLNQEISNVASKSFNIRTGAELRVLELDNGYQSLRGGFAYNSSPYKADKEFLNADYSRTQISLGTGFRYEYFFIDFALSFSSSEDLNNLYELEDRLVPGVKRSYENSQALVTVGWRY